MRVHVCYVTSVPALFMSHSRVYLWDRELNKERMRARKQEVWKEEMRIGRKQNKGGTEECKETGDALFAASLHV